MPIEVRSLDASRIDDFYAYHCPANDAGWCRCVAWWVPTWDGWGERSADENRALRDELFARGEFDGFLAYDADTPVGWCQVGPRDRLSKLIEQYKLQPDANVWAITCFNVAPHRRRQGIARTLLDATLDDLRTHGVSRVQAFPRRGVDPDDDGAIWTGPESLYISAGFEVVRDDPSRPILECRLD